MRCPVDDAVLVMSERSGVEIDYCPTCRGVWLDRGELDKILDRAAQEHSAPPPPPGAPAGAGPTAAPLPYGGAFDDGPLPPPAPQPGYSPQQRYRSHGGFFGSAPSAPSPEDYYRGGYGRPRRRRSWLEDLFD
ncbi:zf-TFIIB domain-containing protein [Ruania albidiflava]|uniref:TFIIB-type zinc ribbon-containing protein n=1 Tax=Ruania albidiflava TaxID=366586 RepID=UPI0003B4C63B|nr:zf-TFIIB domain-containing protein [Ruania albidiflava]